MATDSKYEQTRGTEFFISSTPTTTLMVPATARERLDFTVTNCSMTAPECEDIDVSTLSSLKKQTINGMPAESTVKLDVNFAIMDKGQSNLRNSYRTGENYAFQIKHTSGTTIDWIARVTSYDFSEPKNGIMTGSFSLKVKDDFVFNEPANNTPEQQKGNKS